MKTDSMKIKVYKMSEIAEMLSITKETVRKFIKNGKMRAVYQGSKKEGYLILGTQLQEFLDENEKYRKPYHTYITAYGDPVKETTLKGFISKFLYGIIPYEDFQLISEMNTIYCVKFTLLLTLSKKAIDKNKYHTLKNIITICAMDYKKKSEEESQ